MVEQEIDWARPRRRHAAQPTARLVGRVACAVCQVGRSDVLVCRECAEQPEASRARVETWLAGVDTQEAQAYEHWQATVAQHLAFWEKLLAGRKTHADADTRARQAHPTYALLLDAEAQYQRTAQALQVERARLTKALEALRDL